MRRPAIGLSAFAVLAASSAAAPAQQQTVKYSLVIVASGVGEGSAKNGVGMLNMGIYPGRQECEAAGSGGKVGPVGGGDPEARSSVAISYVCVPLGRP